MFVKMLSVLVVFTCFASTTCGQTVLFEDTFEGEMLDQWQAVGLDRDDYRMRDGGLELRVKPEHPNQRRPMLKVDLPFTTAGTVIASVDVTVIGDPLQRGELAGLCLTDHEGAAFTVRKTNMDGYFVFAPGEVDFIGKPGEEGDPRNYTVKYWPANESFGSIRILVRGHYAHFQVGPSSDGKYKTFFHSAISQSNKGMGFGLTATGMTSDGERWVRFDNFRVTKN